MDATEASQRYLELLKGCLTRALFLEEERWPVGWTGWAKQKRHRKLIAGRVQHALRRRGMEVVRHNPVPEKRWVGRDWPPDAETMIGVARLDHLQWCIETAIAELIPGDLLEAGVWRGGAAIFMRGALAALGDDERQVWVADSFQGLPPPDEERFPADAGSLFSAQPAFAVSVEAVKRNFERYGLLDDRVRFIEGWFEDTLASAPVDALAVLRLDCDMYSSTSTVLEALYPKLSPGGFVIIDDYDLEPCRRAVDDYRAAHGVTEPIEPAAPTRPDDPRGSWWRRGDR